MEEPGNDWRMQDFSFLNEDWNNPWTGELVKKGTQLTRVSVTKLTKEKHLSISLPNATALFLNSSKRSWDSAKLIRKNSNIDSSVKKKVHFKTVTESFDYVERIMESIVMAFTALEVFVNENIPEDYKYHTHKKSEIILETMDKKAIERWLSLDEKLAKVLPEAKKIESPKGQKCWQGYVELKRVRDRIIHMKKDDIRSSGPDIPTLWHKLFKVNAPYIEAKEIIDFFVKKTDVQPRWHREYKKIT